MTDRWRRLEEIYHGALERDGNDRDAFLADACGSDQDLRTEIASLLGYGERHVEPFALKSGTQIGVYRVIEPLASGGMGQVYRARDTALDRDVALKTLPPELASDGSYMARFRREAQVLASLNHPNIATVHGLEDRALVMELVEGVTLTQRLKAGKLKTQEVVRIALQIAEALEAAHRKGIIHRDLKPGNVMIGPSGHVKVLDFGLAKRIHVGEQSQQTAQGAILGTTAYMSPEQAEGRPVDVRSDVFAFGALLYELISGKKPFPGETPLAVLTAILRDEPKPIQNGPRDLVRIAMRCLNKDPDRRFQTITDVKLSLEENDERTAPRVQRQWWPGVVAFCLLVGILVASYHLAPRQAAPAVVVSPLGSGAGARISPDGKMIAYVWTGDRGDNQDVYVKMLGSPGEPLRLTKDLAPDAMPVWSPDGRWISFTRATDTAGAATTVYVVPALGGVERAIAPGRGMDWSRDGANLLLVSIGEQSGLLLANVSNGVTRRILSTPSTNPVISARFAPSGEEVYFTQALSPDRARLSRMKIATGKPISVPTIGIRAAYGFAFHTDVPELIVSGIAEGKTTHSLWRLPMEGGRAVALAFGSNATGVEIAPQSHLLAYTDPSAATTIMRVAAWPGADRESQPWITSASWELTPIASPDGSRIAFSSNRSGVWQIWVSESDGKGQRPITQFTSGNSGVIGSPSWSPDGTQIAFDARLKDSDIWVVPAAGGQAKQLTAETSEDMIPAWSPDGKWVYFTSDRSGLLTLWRVPAGGGAAEQISKKGGYSAKFAPDGRHLYYLKSRRERELWRVSADGGSEELVLPECKTRNFEVLRDGIYFLDAGDTNEASRVRAKARFYRFSTHKIEDLFFETTKPVNPYGMSLSPDGRWLYYSQEDASGVRIMLAENFR